jgi:hypothetical protein
LKKKKEKKKKKDKNKIGWVQHPLGHQGVAEVPRLVAEPPLGAQAIPKLFLFVFFFCLFLIFFLNKKKDKVFLQTGLEEFPSTWSKKVTNM